MKRLLLFVFLFLGLVSQSLAADGSATKIIDRYKKASGGGAASRIKSTLMAGTVKAPGGAVGRFTYQATFPGSLRVDIEAGDVKESECYNGKSAWRLDGRGLRTMLGEEAKRSRLEAILVNGRLGELQRNRIVPQLAAKTTIDGRDANAIEFIKDGVRVKFFFDAGTNLIVKREREAADGLLEIFYGDYRLVDGVKEPFSLNIRRGGSELQVAIERVEHNRVDLTAFRYPQTGDTRPLPELEPLMKAIIANQEKLEEMREKYTCRLVEIERKHDGDGRVKESETHTYEVTPIGDQFVERMISSNGKELSAAEREKEDKRVQKQVEDIIKRREKKQQQKERAQARGENEDKEKNSVSISDFLRISEITSVRREVFRGHEVIAFDFEPRKGFKPRNRGEQIANKLAGTIWVDEEARQIVRLEARLTDSFKMGGGLLASIGPSTAFVFEQDKIDGEVWLPLLMEANVSARLLLFASFNRSMERRYGEYKKYQIDSRYELAKPKENVKP